MKTILVYAACFGAVASSVFAEEDRRPGGDGFDREKNPKREREGKDKEREGRHPHPPFVEGVEMFMKLDTDQDGVITKQEFFTSPRISRLPEEKRERIFARLDRDGDGSLSKEDIQEIQKEGEQRARDFRELDADASGGLNFEEFSQGKFLQKLSEEKRREIFERLDTNRDGEISPKDRPEQTQRPQRPEKKKTE